MRRKAGPKRASFRDTRGNDKNVLKTILKPTKTPTGKGLGKAGAKRLGRLLKRAVHYLEEEPAVKGKVTLPKTPVRLFKHQVQIEAENAPNKKASKPASAQVSRLIVSLVSQCKHRGGISMADLKHTLAAGGYNVTKNNKQVNMVTKRLINNETLVQTTRNASLRLRSKKQNDTNQAKKIIVIPKKPKKGLMQNRRATKGVEKSQRPARKTPKDRRKSYKAKGKTQKKTVKSRKTRGKTRKPTAKSNKRRKKTARARGKMPKQAGRKSRTTKKRAAQVRKAPKKIKRARRRQPRQNRHPYRSLRTSRKAQRKRLHKTISRRARDARRRAYYYED